MHIIWLYTGVRYFQCVGYFQFCGVIFLAYNDSTSEITNLMIDQWLRKYRIAYLVGLTNSSEFIRLIYHCLFCFRADALK